VPLRVARHGDLRRGRILLAGTLVLAGTILVAVFQFTKPKVIYSRSVSDFVRRPLLETPVRVEGVLVTGSLCKIPSTCEFRFRLTGSPYATETPQNELEVRYEQCVIPDMFRDVPRYELSLTVEGELREDRRIFDATVVLAKCPSKYEIPTDPAILEAMSRPVRPCTSNDLER
jgi:cytochrome c-type biogenesis protein CcmE